MDVELDDMCTLEDCKKDDIEPKIENDSDDENVSGSAHRYGIEKAIPKEILRITIEEIEANPRKYLGIPSHRFSLLNAVFQETKVPPIDCYLTLRKLRLNEDYSLLAGYFMLSVLDMERIFKRTITALASYLRYLISWPKSNFNWQKFLPYTGVIECVSTDMHNPIGALIECSQYKFLLCLMPNNKISFVSEAYVGSLTNQSILIASDILNIIPETVHLVPGTELSNEPELNFPAKNRDIYNGNEDSKDKKKKVTICHQQIQYNVSNMRKFRVLRPFAIKERFLFESLNEILVVVAALHNLMH